MGVRRGTIKQGGQAWCVQGNDIQAKTQTEEKGGHVEVWRQGILDRGCARQRGKGFDLGQASDNGKRKVQLAGV